MDWEDTTLYNLPKYEAFLSFLAPSLVALIVYFTTNKMMVFVFVIASIIYLSILFGTHILDDTAEYTAIPYNVGISNNNHSLPMAKIIFTNGFYTNDQNVIYKQGPTPQHSNRQSNHHNIPTTSNIPVAPTIHHLSGAPPPVFTGNTRAQNLAMLADNVPHNVPHNVPPNAPHNAPQNTTEGMTSGVIESKHPATVNPGPIMHTLLNLRIICMTGLFLLGYYLFAGHVLFKKNTYMPEGYDYPEGDIGHEGYIEEDIEGANSY